MSPRNRSAVSIPLSSRILAIIVLAVFTFALVVLITPTTQSGASCVFERDTSFSNSTDSYSSFFNHC